VGYAVTSWFIDQVTAVKNVPLRKFYIGASDYSDRVLKWPTLNRSTRDLKSVNPRMELANQDNGLGLFINSAYSLAQSDTIINATINIGFAHPTSGDEVITVYKGSVQSISFKGEKCTFTLRDKLWRLEETKVGDSTIPVSFTNIIPSDIAWTICTCYGPLSSVASTSNPDIDYTSWLEWAAAFSQDNVQMSAYYDGVKTKEALQSLVRMTDSGVWVEGDDRLHFARFNEVSSLDTTIIPDYIEGIEINVDPKRLVTKSWVYGDYDITSDDWGINVYSENTSLSAQFGTLESVMKETSIWATNSTQALQLAQRLSSQDRPPTQYMLTTPGPGIERYVSETMRFVSSFYAISSADGWRITEKEFNLSTFTVKTTMDTAITWQGFYLDVDSLDQDRPRLL